MKEEWALYLFIGSAAAGLVMLLIVLVRTGRFPKGGPQELHLLLEQAKADWAETQNRERELLSRSARETTISLGKYMSGEQTRSLETLQQSLAKQLEQFQKQISNFTLETNRNLDAVRASISENLMRIRADSNQKLGEMRTVVEEKLQKTINDRMTESFRLVNDRLEQVYRGLGEMQTLAQGVGDLKKVLTNVKSRGVLGEIQLGAILEDILTPDQYDVNVATVPDSRNYVEYAVRIPTENGGFLHLPIDAKFPGDTYLALLDAYENGTNEEIRAAAQQLKIRIRTEAKEIRDKYLAPPFTTDFGILFLPVEGLYAEVIRQGLVESLQRDFRVNVAGPSTMAALLNALQMSFRSIAIQKRSGEVWKILGAVKNEFEKFSSALTQTQQKLETASQELDQLVGVRTRQITKKLREVESLTDLEASRILPPAETENGLKREGEE